MKNLLIVESPAKAKTIGKYLGKDYMVMASFGHIRDLPSKDGSVEPNNDFAMHYQVSAKSSKHVKEIVDAAKSCQKLILAPDPDREGESIAWHVLEVLKQKKSLKKDTPIERVVFNAITKNSVSEAIKNPRDIDMDLVNAQQARRALDYLVGFTLSPVLWRKLPGSRSAGRVQSVSLRLICDREDEIENFKSEEYWDIKLDLKTAQNDEFQANLVELAGKKLEKFSIITEVQAGNIKKLLEEKKYQVLSITKRQAKRRPQAPFTTSSMQQEAARKLGFSASRTMMLAQRLYEGIEIDGAAQGLITYMRTDSVDVTFEAISAVRTKIENLYGKNYLPESPNVFKSKVKNAQEAHEAIRPTDFSLTPDKVKKHLDDAQFALYDLVWKRMLASQMADVIFDQVIVEITTIPSYAKARAVGSTIRFDGFYRVYREDRDEGEGDDEEEKQNLPDLKEKENLDLIEVKPQQHFTEPPPRYSEASLVKKMEELGIGRPSTYAAIISVLQDRGYVKLDRRRFFPEERGRIVTTFLKEFFSKYVEYDYTANLEDELDIISNGKMNWKNFLNKFWKDFHGNTSQVMEKPFPEVLEVLNQKVGGHIFGRDEKGELKNTCPTCGNGKLGLRLGKFGAFIGCSNYPACKHTMQIFAAEGGEEREIKPQFEPKSLGNDPKSGAEILVKVGPYGPYLELIGTANKEHKEEKSPDKKSNKSKKEKAAKKPKRVSIPKNIDPNMIDLETATQFLALPREVGAHPETGEKIIANIGPFGPYLLHNKKFTSVKEDNIFEIGLNRAVDLIASSVKKKATRIRKSKNKHV
ncbi:MAG: DNA topoisomerase I [Alphaproteobacteria bacterium RIFCSPLOWO2_01_FULL_40_26]|nr:MAG: DNA topoisomerase I [Alphaproteobacteria bacterium RIFCSPHIGHO2_02_FULL_40_34]OFW93888.1 MAG: DNA topoisomerase I [Alphaproteobacteria bacterium RIFCSPLOWO2_01_FULL_40_26]OFX09161.1 MAG: DNA topoisomerase I [Alphaproteobacteria bacterium RIFCSPLOWO2_02_FULL_40_19]OFX11106.1 MAG: DNA topoisomerase I [Alphaproteobacteria bacterium RIFCSPLOWO2_12_FULL_40_11]